MTQWELARAAGHSRTYITRLEAGQLPGASITDVCQISHVFGLEVWQLLMAAEIVGVEETTSRRVTAVTNLVSWVAAHPGDLQVLLECARTARDYPQAWTTVRMLLRKPARETIGGA